MNDVYQQLPTILVDVVPTAPEVALAGATIDTFLPNTVPVLMKLKRHFVRTEFTIFTHSHLKGIAHILHLIQIKPHKHMATRSDRFARYARHCEIARRYTALVIDEL